MTNLQFLKGRLCRICRKKNVLPTRSVRLCLYTETLPSACNVLFPSCFAEFYCFWASASLGTRHICKLMIYLLWQIHLASLPPRQISPGSWFVTGQSQSFIQYVPEDHQLPRLKKKTTHHSYVIVSPTLHVSISTLSHY